MMMTHEIYGAACLHHSVALQGYVFFKVQMDLGYSLTNIPAGRTDMFPAHSRKNNVTVTKGKVRSKDKHLFADCDTRPIDQGQHCLYLVLAALLSTDQYLSVYDAMETAFQTWWFLWPKTQFIHLNSYVH